jgi:cytosine/adenosine deaminase-related metal-dependent hydrolase
LKETGTFNVHNPRSNISNGVGIAPVGQMLKLRQPVGLGSDGFCDMPQEMLLAKHLQTLEARDPSAFSDHLALKLVYEHNAQYLERIFDRRFGRIAQGYAADLVLAAYCPATPVESGNIRSHVVAALNSASVRTVLVGGKVVMRDGEILGLDEDETLARAKTQAAQLWARL